MRCWLPMCPTGLRLINMGHQQSFLAQSRLRSLDSRGVSGQGLHRRGQMLDELAGTDGQRSQLPHAQEQASLSPLLC